MSAPRYSERAVTCGSCFASIHHGVRVAGQWYCDDHDPAQPDDEDVCSEEDCDASLDDGEGYDGLCGDHADRAEAEGRWSHHDDD